MLASALALYLLTGLTSASAQPVLDVSVERADAELSAERVSAIRDRVTRAASVSCGRHGATSLRVVVASDGTVSRVRARGRPILERGASRSLADEWLACVRRRLDRVEVGAGEGAVLVRVRALPALDLDGTGLSLAELQAVEGPITSAEAHAAIRDQLEAFVASISRCETVSSGVASAQLFVEDGVVVEARALSMPGFTGSSGCVLEAARALRLPAYTGRSELRLVFQLAAPSPVGERATFEMGVPTPRFELAAGESPTPPPHDPPAPAPAIETSVRVVSGALSVESVEELAASHMPQLGDAIRSETEGPWVVRFEVVDGAAVRIACDGAPRGCSGLLRVVRRWGFVAGPPSEVELRVRHR